MSNRRVKMAREEVKYALRNGRISLGGVSAQVIGEELSRIAESHGGLTAPVVVDEARPEDSSLHPAFEWRDPVAGERWREHQARNLIRAVQVVSSNEAGERETAPVFVHVPSATTAADGTYQPVSVVVSRPDLYLSALGQLVRKVAEASAAVEELKAAAKQSSQPRERLVAVEIAATALQTAKEALASLH
jgi:hypothetical protein